MVNVRFGNQTIRLEPFKKWAIFIGNNNRYINVFRCVCVFLKSFCDIFGKIITTRLCLNTYKYLERFIFWHDIHYHCIIDVIDIRRLVTTVHDEIWSYCWKGFTIFCFISQIRSHFGIFVSNDSVALSYHETL